jgi:hypothetical protein
MAENVQRSRGRPGNYKFDRGGVAAEMGPYIGIVVNNVDAVRAGRLQVYIEEFGATNSDGTPNLTDTTLWRTVSYCPPFYGSTPINVGSTSAGVGTYPGNRNTYGMWFTPPDLGVRVVCFFVGGDPSQGIYIGCVPDSGSNHMVPAIGATNKYVPGNAKQKQIFADTPALPVTEINVLNNAINENPRFYDQPKPVQSVVAGILVQQGLNKDPIRGPIRSSSQRESPSSVYGISTPGTAIYQGGADPKTIRSQLEKGEIKPQDIAVIGRKGGHTFVMDDGDLDGKDTLIRIRTAKGHQITMSDDGDCFFITHANGQTWMEFGKQGTVDVYSTNSINLRTQGTLNLHADKNINMYAGGSIKMKAQDKLFVEAAKTMVLNSLDKLVLSAKKYLGLRSDGPVAVKSKIGSWEATSALNLKGKVINLNGAPTVPVPEIPELPTFKLAGTEFNPSVGWEVKPGLIETIVTRAPTHEPYPYHGKGVNNSTDLNSTTTSTDPTSSTVAAESVQAEITGQLGSSTQPTVANATVPKTSLQTKADSAFVSVSSLPVSKPIDVQNYVSELPSNSAIGQEAQEIYNIGQRLANPSPIPTVTPTLQEQIAAVERAQEEIQRRT